MREIRPTRQIPNEPFRKWFAGDPLDLIVWFDSAGEIIGFQLCYPMGADERALTWWRDKGFSHDRIDDGEGLPDSQKMTPILVPDGAFDKKSVIALIKEKCEGVDPQLARFVAEKLEGYPQADE